MTKNSTLHLAVLCAASMVTTLAVPAIAAGSSAAGQAVVQKMIAAHGGLDAWAAAPTVAFTEEFRQGEETSGSPGRVVVKQDSRQAYLDYGGPLVGWDGEKAWSVAWPVPTPPRFLALLNYYFGNLAWLTQDPGVILGEPGTAQLWDDPTEWITVKMTFEPGVGDTPDDYYVLYIHPETHRLHANEYVVTYRGVLPEGVTVTDPHVLIYDEHATVDGLAVPTHYTIYQLDGSIYASCVLGDWSFSEPWNPDWMVMPEGAVVDETEP